MQKGQLTLWTLQIWVVGTVTFSAKRSKPPHSGVCSRYAVRSRCEGEKVNLHCGLCKYGWWGPLPLVQKSQTTHSGVHSTAVSVNAKRSTHKVDFANMGGGNHYL